MTARDIVTMAMKELKTIESGGEPSAEELRDGLTSLRAMLRSWQTYANLWREVTASVPVAYGTLTVTLPDDVRSVTGVREVGSYERPLTSWESADYAFTPNKAQLGRPLAYVENRSRDAVTLTLWPRPQTNTVLKVDYQRKADEIADGSSTIDVPDDWLETVWTNLAVRLSGMFGSSAELAPELVDRAGALLTALRDDDRPDSYYMGTDRYA